MEWAPIVAPCQGGVSLLCSLSGSLFVHPDDSVELWVVRIDARKEQFEQFDAADVFVFDKVTPILWRT